MGKNGKGLAVFALIFGLIGAGTGGYLFVQDYLLAEEETTLPKARVYYDAATYWLLSNSAGKILDFTNVSYDTHNAFNLTSNLYIVPESGIYQVNAQFSIDALAGDNFVVYIIRNNSFHSFRRYTSSMTVNNLGIGVSDMVNATVGDEISIRGYFYTSGGGIRLISGNEYLTYFSIAKLA